MGCNGDDVLGLYTVAMSTPECQVGAIAVSCPDLEATDIDPAFLSPPGNHSREVPPMYADLIVAELVDDDDQKASNSS
jgi:hypothetical protein